MPLYAGELNIRQGVPLADFPAPLSEVLRAQFQETVLHNPVTALLRLNEMGAAERGEIEGYTDLGPEMGQVPIYGPAKRMDAETARARVKEEGLPLKIEDEGISERALDILIKRKRDELRREAVYARGPSGIGTGAARLGVSLAASLLDPLNIASAFVPVVGQARYARMLGQAAGPLGRAGVRTGVGAAEGAVGAAILEPLIYSAAQAEQMDYTMADSLLNVAFGSLFGGGLHVGAGAVRDLVQPGWWKQGTGAETPNVVRPDPATPIRTEPISGSHSIMQLLAKVDEEADLALAGNLNQRLKSMEPDLRAIFGRQTDEEKPEKLTPTQLLKRALDELQANPSAIFDAARSKPEIFSTITRAVDALSGREGAPSARDIAVRVEPETRQAALRAAVAQAVDGRATEVDALVRSDPTSVAEPTVTLYRGSTSPQGRAGDWWTTDRKKAEKYGNVEEVTLPARLAAKWSAQGHGGPDEFVFPDKKPYELARDGDGVGGVTQGQARAAAQTNAQSVRSAEPVASDVATREAAEAKPVDLASAEAELEQALDLAESLGGKERAAAELADAAKLMKRADDYEKALKVAAACGIA